MRSWRQGGLALLGLVGALIAGCGGGGSDGSSDEGPALMRAEFVREASSLCERSRHTAEKRFETAEAWLRPGADTARRREEKAIRYMVVVPAAELSESLRRLGPIRGEAERLEAYAPALARDAELAREKPLTVTAGAAFVASNTLANGLGLSDCVH